MGTTMLKRVFGVLVLLAGCSDPPSQPAASNALAAQAVKAPFEYRITEKRENKLEPEVVLNIETTNDAAKKATEEDLRQFWQYIGADLGDRSVFIAIKSDVPGATAWGVINHLKRNSEWEVKVEKHEWGVDAEPHFFPDKIDPNNPDVILTLSVTNRIVERLQRVGLKVKRRSDDIIELDLETGSLPVVLSPESISVVVHNRDDATLFSLIETLTKELEIADDIKEKLQSVIGSPGYIHGNSKGKGVSVWNWTIDNYDVVYYHTEPGADDLYITHHNVRRRKGTT
jgi:hypothetical protein